MKYIRVGEVTRGNWNDGRWEEVVDIVIASGATKKALAASVTFVTMKHTSKGYLIDFGLIDNTQSVVWGPRYKIQKDNK